MRNSSIRLPYIKHLSIALIVLMIISFCGCSAGTKPQGADEAINQTTGFTGDWWYYTQQYYAGKEYTCWSVDQAALLMDEPLFIQAASVASPEEAAKTLVMDFYKTLQTVALERSFVIHTIYDIQIKLYDAETVSQLGERYDLLPYGILDEGNRWSVTADTLADYLGVTGGGYSPEGMLSLIHI